MNVKSTAAMVSVLLAAAGCHYFLPPAEPQIGQVPERNSVRSGGLELTVELAKRRFTVGETFTVQITAPRTPPSLTSRFEPRPTQ